MLMKLFVTLLSLLVLSSSLLAQPRYSPNDTLNAYDVHYMKLDLEVMDTSVFIKGSATLQVRMVQDSKVLLFDLLNNMSVDSVFVNGSKANFIHSGNRLRMSSSDAWKKDALVTTKVYYSGSPVNGLSYLGKRSGFPTVSNVSESYLLWCWLPCKQVLTDKIDSVDVWVTTKKNLKAYANGLLQDSIALPGNKIQYQWHSSYPITYYLITLGVGNYAVLKDTAPLGSGDSTSLPLLFYLYNSQSYIAAQSEGAAKTKSFIHLLDSLYGIYPFAKEKYGVGVAQIFATQGMENQTMSVNQDMSAWLNIHELQHQWFGDAVTCKTFNDIWLHEGFATYAEMLGIEFLPQISPGNVKDYVAGWHKSVTSQPGGSVYVPTKDTYNENRIFDDRLTYNKGASIIHTLRFETGNDTLFFAALRHYLSSYFYGNANVSDFIKAWQEATGKDLTTFFNQWYYGEGYPTYTLTFSQRGKQLTIQSSQAVSAPSITPFFQMKMEYKISTTKGDTTITHYQNNPVESFSIPVSGTVTSLVADPNDWVIDGSDKAKKNSVETELNHNITSVRTTGIFPNPSPNHFLLKTETAFNHIDIYNSQDELVFSKEEALNTESNVHSALKEGVYIVVCRKGTITTGAFRWMNGK